MENTIQNRTKFFAQYWGQIICCVRIEDAPDVKDIIVDLSDWKVRYKHSYLELKPLSSISDEDAIDFLHKLEDKEFCDRKTKREKIEWGKAFIESFITHRLSPQCYIISADFLRSKGYALPWNGITVEQQIEFGWIKLKN